MTLKIQRLVERMTVVFALTGRVQAEQVPELEALLGSESSERDIVLDLRHVKLVDRDAVQFLATIEKAGTELRNCSAYVREWITQEKNAMQRKEIRNAAGLAG
jgi:anti-anti-sigma regulatory factor